MVLYICNKKKECNENCGECKHTKDVEHAKNFKLEGKDYIEQDHIDDLKKFLRDISSFELYKLLIKTVSYETLLGLMYQLVKDYKKVFEK